MYVISFYSFKGGVGRTMALANVAHELCMAGKRVLLVDFDLEAPGLHTFDFASRVDAREQPGVVDFVLEYSATGIAPDVRGYVGTLDCPGSGSLLLMPCGRQDAGYASRLQSLTFSELYASRDGYLLFEDLRAQWDKYLGVDYVLIDSRTGYTDSAGICTRQLPDAVVLLFYPNRQNLIGIAEVANGVRARPGRDQGRPIGLHFVAANVPSLDDEELILQRLLTEAQAVLRYRELDAVIHHYDSLRLLGQEVFVATRPKTRLAREYRELSQALMRSNLADRDGALLALERRGTQFPDGLDSLSETFSQLDTIARTHAGDGEVLFRCGGVYERFARFDEAISLYGQAQESGYVTPALLMRRALAYRMSDEDALAEQDLRQLLRQPVLEFAEFVSAISMLRESDPQALEGVPDSEAWNKLESFEQALLLQEFIWDGLLPVAERVARGLASRAQPDAPVRHSIGLCHMATSRFKEAMALFEPHAGADLSAAFNLAMAKWAAVGEIDKSAFSHVLELSSQGLPRRDPNYLQCMSITQWALGDAKRAHQLASDAKKSRVRTPVPTFSAWRFMNVTSEVFANDIDEMVQAYDIHDVVPRFMRASHRAAD